MTWLSLVPSDRGHIFQASTPDQESDQYLVLMVCGQLLFDHITSYVILILAI